MIFFAACAKLNTIRNARRRPPIFVTFLLLHIAKRRILLQTISTGLVHTAVAHKGLAAK